MRKKGLLFGMAALMAVSMTACSDSESAESSTAAGQRTDAAKEENTFPDAAGNTSAAPADGNEYDDGDDDEENGIYRQQAEAVYAKVEQMLTALKEGDIDTLIKLGDPDDDVVEALSNVSNPEAAKKILKTLYANLCWEITEDDLERLAWHLQELTEAGERDTDDEYDLYMDALAYQWMINFDDNALLYFKAGDVVPEDFVPGTEEQAWEILQAGLDNTPLTSMSGLTITVPDEEGNFRFLYDEDYLFEHAELEDLRYYSADQLVQQYVSELMDVGSDKEICDTEAKYENDDAFFAQAAQYAADKDFEALTELLKTEVEKDYRSEYGAYDELNDAQKAFVDSMVEQLVVTWADYSWTYGNGEEYRDGSIRISFPAFIGESNEQIAEFLKEHQVMDDGGIFYLGSKNKTMGSCFLYPYYQCIKYAKEHIE